MNTKIQPQPSEETKHLAMYRLSDIKLHIWFDSAHHDLVILSEVEGEKV